MQNFRLAILDYTKEQLDNPTAQKMLGDILFEKQKNFLRTDENYVVMDKHDMIGTHYLIYDTTRLHEPKLIFAIRTTYYHRAQQHRLETPLMNLIPTLDEKSQHQFQSFFTKHPQLVDCNAWFVNPDYSKKNSGLNLSDLGYFLVTMNLLRFGYDNFVGCTNEKYNASRWLHSVGKLEDTGQFIHPAVQCPHKLILMSQFNLEHAKMLFDSHRELIQSAFEVFPDKFASPYSLFQFAERTLKEYKATPIPNEKAA